jgi:hypothetical protein
MGKTRSAKPRSTVSSRAPSKASLQALARRHLEGWGLAEPAALEQAAERLARAVLAGAPRADDPALVGRMRALAERWIADFAGAAAHPGSHWIWHAGPLLNRFPTTFLLTPLPQVTEVNAEAGKIRLLPERVPAVIKQQTILGPLEHVLLALREVARRARSAVPDEQPQTIANPAE